MDKTPFEKWWAENPMIIGNLPHMIARATWDAATAAEMSRIVDVISNLYPEIDDPGWLVQDQKRAIAFEIVNAIHISAINEKGRQP